jgi:hypothetical protein
MTRAFLLFSFTLFVPAFLHAQVVITEIMYDLAEGSDSGREWVEVYNAGGTPVALTAWKVFESGTNHKITAVSGGEVLAPGAYALIADNVEKFKVDVPAFSGQLFDSAFSLSNDGETIALRDGKLVESDSVSYTNQIANGTGDSLQRLSSDTFDAGMPTPGNPIPDDGLTKAPPKPSKSAAQKNTSVADPIEIIGDADESTPAVAAVATTRPETTSVIWWLAPLFLATIGAGGIVTARAYKRDEWEIEEIV